MKVTSQLLSGAVALLGAAGVNALPQVDLGYEIHEAVRFNVSRYSFPRAPLALPLAQEWRLIFPSFPHSGD
jgi:hypothetical protein